MTLNPACLVALAISRAHRAQGSAAPAPPSRVDVDAALAAGRAPAGVVGACTCASCRACAGSRVATGADGGRG